jgi:hypothetical protein
MTFQTRQTQNRVVEVYDFAGAINRSLDIMRSGFVTPEMFGAAGNMRYDLVTQGPRFLGGTNDLVAFQLADAAAKARGVPVIALGQYYIEGTFEPKAAWHSSPVAPAVIWQKIGTTDVGIWIRGNASGVVFKHFRLIRHYDNQGIPKAANSGHMCNALTVGEFLIPTLMAPIEDIDIDIEVVAAANISGVQVSNDSHLVNVMGWATGRLKVRPWAYTNRNVGAIIQAHWGGQVTGLPADFVPGRDNPLPSGHGLEMVATSHAQDLFIDISGPEWNHATHPATGILIYSAPSGIKISGCSSRGYPRPILQLAGDEVDFFARPEQKNAVGKTVEYVGFHRHMACRPDIGNQTAACVFNFRGTSKFPGQYPLDGRVVNQLEYKIIGQGFHVEIAPEAGSRRALRFFGGNGKIDLGPLWGYTNSNGTAILLQTGRGMSADIREGAGQIDVQFARIDYLRAGVSMGDSQTDTAGSGTKRFGWQANNEAVLLQGRILTTALAAPLNYGDTTMTVVPFPTTEGASDLQAGTVLLVNGGAVTLRQNLENGQSIAQIYASTWAASTDAPIVIEQRAVVKHLVAEFDSSEWGVRLNRADVLHGDFSRVRWFGRNAARMTDDSTMTVIGALPMGARHFAISASERDTFRVEAGCRLTIRDALVRCDDPTIRSVVDIRRLTVDSAETGRGFVEFVNCRIVGDPAKLITFPASATAASGLRPNFARLTNCRVAYGTQAEVTLADIP